MADALSRVTTGAVIPVNLCCRGGNLPTPARPRSSGDTVVGVGAEHLEDKAESVEKVPTLLRAPDVPTGTN